MSRVENLPEAWVFVHYWAVASISRGPATSFGRDLTYL
jgi:hypothetical protein